MSNENRTPAGVPTGGQFAASSRDEAGVSLEKITESHRHVWSEDPDKVKVPKAARGFVSDAEDAGFDVKVEHTSHTIAVHLSKPDSQNSMSVHWSAGNFYNEPNTGKLDFRVEAGTPGVRFDYAQGFAHGEYVSPRSARQARLYIGLEA